MHSLRILIITLFAATITTGVTTLTGLTDPASAATGSIWQVETTVNVKYGGRNWKYALISLRSHFSSQVDRNAGG